MPRMVGETLSSILKILTQKKGMRQRHNAVLCRGLPDRRSIRCQEIEIQAGSCSVLHAIWKVIAPLLTISMMLLASDFIVVTAIGVKSQGSWSRRFNMTACREGRRVDIARAGWLQQKGHCDGGSCSSRRTAMGAWLVNVASFIIGILQNQPQIASGRIGVASGLSWAKRDWCQYAAS